MERAEFERLRAAAVQLRADGWSRRQIAQRLGVRSSETLTRLLAGTVPPEWTRRPTAKDGLRRAARELRRSGLTYPEIKRQLHVSTSTLSLWLRDIPLATARLRERSEHAAMMREARWARYREDVARVRAETKAGAAREIGTLTERDLLLLGAVAYWCEGQKDKPWDRRERVVFVNSDERLIRLCLAWLRALSVEPGRCRLRISIHESADVAAAHDHWSRVTGVPVADFQRPTLKGSSGRTNRRNVTDGYHGCLIVVVLDSASLYRQVEGWFTGIAEALPP